MSAIPIIKSLLDASTAVAAIAGTRLYCDTRPEGDPLPAVVWSEISDTPYPPIDITPGSEPMTGRIQVSCFGRGSNEVMSLKDAVIGACHKQSGTIAGTAVMAVLQDATGPSSYDALVDIYQQSVDFIVHYLR